MQPSHTTMASRSNAEITLPSAAAAALATVRTVAGKVGEEGRADGPATEEGRFISPNGLAVDAKGGVLVIDFSNHCVRYLSPDCLTLTTVAGKPGEAGAIDGPVAAGARLAYPRGLALDSKGGVFIADYGNNCVRYLSPDHKTLMTVAGKLGQRGAVDGAATVVARLNGPNDVSVDAGGGVFVTEEKNHCVRYLSPDRTTLTTVAGKLGTPGAVDGQAVAEARLNDPHGVAVDSEGGVFVADKKNRCLRYLSSDRTLLTTVAGKLGEGGSADGLATEQARLSEPSCLSVDGAGGILVSDMGSVGDFDNQCVRYLSPDRTTLTTVAGRGARGSVNGLATSEARFFNPHGVGVDRGGRVFVADQSNRCIRRIDGLGLAQKSGAEEAAASELLQSVGDLSGDLSGWLAAINAQCVILLAPLDEKYGVEEVADLLDLDPEHIDELCALLKVSRLVKVILTSSPCVFHQ